ncbi:MAG: TRAP transporter small permease subunit [Deltaproteobacteria bacterium]|nr:TRAP transporter small permease subunit [Deltaproteobacteria bacterium]
MGFLLRLASVIDRGNQWLGKKISWLVLAMVLLGAFNSIARFLGPYLGRNLSSNAFIEAQWYMFSLLFLLGAGYVLQRDTHVRVDVLYANLSRRGKAWVDLLGGVFLLIPFCLFGLWSSWPSVANSFAVREVSPDPGGLPRYPIKAMILVCFALLFLQGISQVIQQVSSLRESGSTAGDHSGETLS